ncbi:MAG: CDP-alcohol phosphatidyltransferase family protein [Chloroflexi bacterium CG07_land_8_20_14_0_80_45_17]|nr:MAG: CDP-alcohol phosphatidyltransferase [Chloroflexi bacterium CG23_combo_of_CG06-09_8_20_14_all_45_10]PIU56570.1 MAG: CDP-alcohol phosphatidyltransferase family protein [Chloroflexi bacterium CG07_land_8_20_14_0_80_45_17]
MANLVEIRGTIASYITNPIVGILSKSRLKPNTLTFIELAISIGAAYAIAIGYFLLGGVLVLVSGLFDLLDGALARFTKQSTKFGAILDSTIDRLSEAAIFCGLLVWYMPKVATLEIVLIFAALIGSFLVSYIRARAEGLGLECRVGLFTRAERVIVLAVGLLVNQVFIALWVLVVFVYITVAQRLLYLRKQAKVRGG